MQPARPRSKPLDKIVLQFRNRYIVLMDPNQQSYSTVLNVLDSPLKESIYLTLAVVLKDSYRMWQLDHRRSGDHYAMLVRDQVGWDEFMEAVCDWVEALRDRSREIRVGVNVD